MTRQEAQARAREVARSLGLNPEDTGILISESARLADRTVNELDEASSVHRAAAQAMPYSPLVGAHALLLTMLREEAVVEGLPKEQAEEYVGRMHGIDRFPGIGGGTGLGPPEEIAEGEAEKKRAGEQAQRDVRAAKVAELRRHPAMMDPTHKEHNAVVEQLYKLHESE